MASLRVFAFGGGVQSTAALVLAAEGKIDYTTFLFCNVGDDSEYPPTLAYVHDVAMPYAREHDLDLIELQRTRFGQPETLYQRLMRQDRSVSIPIRMAPDGAPGNRNCTGDFKIKVIAKWLKEHGATSETPAIAGMGISLDEFQRMRSDSGIAYEKLAYPLIDLRLTRQDCINIINNADLPVPPKSACWFCPFHSKRRWQEMRQNEPELFWKSVELENSINQKRGTLGRDQVYFLRKCVPLSQGTTDYQQDSLFDDDVCDSGYCMT